MVKPKESSKGGGKKHGMKTKGNRKRKREDGQNSHKKKPFKKSDKPKKVQKEEKREKDPYREAYQALASVWGVNFSDKKPKARYPIIADILKKTGKNLKHVLARKGAPKALCLVVKYGNHDQRRNVVLNLTGALCEISKGEKQHDILIKLLNYCKKPEKLSVCEELIQDVNMLANNRYACMVLDRILLDPELRTIKLLCLQQLYSKIYMTIPEKDEKGKPLTLEQILVKSPEQKIFILQNIRKFLENALSKSPSLVLVQLVLHQYVHACEISDLAVWIDALPEIAMQVQQTLEGCLALVRCFDYCNAKQRKKFLQAFKSHVTEMAYDKESIMILVRALDVTDDTVLLKKTILSQLLQAEQIPEVCSSKFARLIFLHILDPRQKRFFTQKQLESLAEPILASSGAKHFNCKKECETRRRELLKVILGPLVEHLETKIANSLKKSTQQEPLLYPVLQQCFGKLHPLREKGTALLQKIAEHCRSNQELFTDGTSQRRLRGLAELIPEFCDILVDTLDGTQIQAVAIGLGALVLARCYQNGSEKCKAKLKSSLAPIGSNLKERAADVRNIKILVEELAL